MSSEGDARWVTSEAGSIVSHPLYRKTLVTETKVLSHGATVWEAKDVQTVAEGGSQQRMRWRR